MNTEKLDKMSGMLSRPRKQSWLAILTCNLVDEQIGQLYELMQAIKSQDDGEATEEQDALVESMKTS